MRDDKGRFIKGSKGHLGYSHSEESKIKISLAKSGQIVEKENPQWDDIKFDYRGLHKWIQNKLGKATQCMKDVNHKSTRYHWANISKEYKRDFSDWMQMCPSCNCKDRIGRRVSA